MMLGIYLESLINIVSQFTLMASIKKNKPSFHHAASPQIATTLYEHVLKAMKETYGPQKEEKVKSGIFQAYMEVGLVNDGPVTIELVSR